MTSPSNILDLRSKIAQQLKSNNEKHVALGLFIVFCVFNILNFDPYLFLGGDNARYLILAKALARGYGYRDIYLPDAPFHSHFPFGFPLLLTPIIFLFSEQLIFAKLYVMFFSLGSFWLVYRMTKRYFNTQEWILPMIFFSVSPLIIFYSHYVLSEIPYLFFSFLAIYFLSKYDEKHFNIAVIILTIFSVIFTYYIRTAGIALVVAVGVYFLLKRRIKAFSMIFLPSLLAILLINITTKVNASSYRNEFILKNPYVPEAGYLTISEFFQRIFDNLVLYSFKIFPQVICPTLKNNLALVILGIFLAILIIASILKEFKNITLVSIYFVLYIGVILAWPQTWSNERFLLPILPILFYYITKGARTIAKKPVIILSVITLVYLSGTIASHFQTIPESVKKIKKYLSGDELGGYPDYWFNYFSIIKWIKYNTPEHSVVISRKPEFVYLISGRKSFCYPFSTDENKFFEMVNKYRPKYLIYDDFTNTNTLYLLPIITRYPQKFKVIFITKPPEVFLLELDDSLFSRRF